MSTYHHGDLRTALLRTAGKRLEKEGVEGLSLRALTRRAGVSHAAPYRHFRDRESLLAALAAEGFAMLGRAQREAVAAGDLRAMGEAYVRFALDHPERFRLMFGGRIAIERHPELREVATRTFAGLSGALAGQVGTVPGAREASVAAWALVHGLSHLLLDQKLAGGSGDAAQVQAFVRAVLGSVRFAVNQPPA